MKIKRAEYVSDGSNIAMIIRFYDGPRAIIDPEAYRWFYQRYQNVVYLGNWEGKCRWWHRGRWWRGFTTDPAVVALVKKFCHDCNTPGAFKVGRVI